MDEKQLFMHRREAANYLKERHGFGAERTLAKGVVTGDTPEHRKCGRLVLYTVDALDEWALSKIGPAVRLSAETERVLTVCAATVHIKPTAGVSAMSQAMPEQASAADTVRKRDSSREARLQADIAAWLREALPYCLVFPQRRFIFAERGWSTQMVRPIGVADIVVVASGRVVFLEIKTPDGVVSLQQRAFGPGPANAT
jgi:hypothetical protein